MVMAISPSSPAISPRNIDLPAMPQIVDSPNTTRAKISAGPNDMAMRETRFTDTTITMRLKMPPKVETITAMPSAIDARPVLAMG